MIKLFTYIIIIIFILTSITYAQNRTPLFESKKDLSENRKKAKLLENYIYNLKNNLIKLKNKYEIKGNFEIDQIQKELSIMIVNLKKLQKFNFKKSISEKVNSEIIKRLKIITPKLKKILKDHKKLFNLKSSQLKLKYINIANILSNKIERIISSIYKPIKNKTNYSLKDSKKITYLKSLLKENNKLKNIIEWKTINEKDIKNELKKILKNIKNTISWLKNIIN